MALTIRRAQRTDINNIIHLLMRWLVMKKQQSACNT